MLSGATFRAAAMAGAAVFKIVVSNDSMKNATATSHGRSRLLDGSIVGTGAGFGMRGRERSARQYSEVSPEPGVRNRPIGCAQYSAGKTPIAAR